MSIKRKTQRIRTRIQNLKRGILVSICMVLFIPSVTFAAFSVTTWNNPSTWMKNGSTISAQKLGENLSYLYAVVQKNLLASKISLGTPSYITGVGYIRNGITISTCPNGNVASGIKIHGIYQRIGTWRYIITGIQPACVPIQVNGQTISSATASTGWNDPNVWVQNGGIIPSAKLSGNLNYLFTNTTSNISTSNISLGSVSYGVNLGYANEPISISLCPVGNIMTGVIIYEKYTGVTARFFGIPIAGIWRNIINGMQPVCAPLKVGASTVSGTPSNQSSVPLNTQGIQYGKSISANTLSGLFQYVYTKVTGSSASSLSASSRVTLGIPFRGAGVGYLRNGTETTVCPNGNAVTGIKMYGGYKGNPAWRYIFNGMQLQCAPIKVSSNTIGVSGIVYTWQVGAWGACTSSSIQTRTVSCISNSPLSPAGASTCTGVKPATSQACTYTPPPVYVPPSSPAPYNQYTGWGIYNGPRCFIAGTMVTMADGSKKRIEDVKIGEYLLGENGTKNKVLAFERPPLGIRKLNSINDGPYFITSAHPLRTTDGWKSISIPAIHHEVPALIGELKITQLKIGDKLLRADGSTVTVTSIRGRHEKNQRLYNFVLNGNRTYYADGYLAHDEFAKGEK